LEAKADTDFVGTSLRHLFREMIGKNPNLKVFIIWSDGGCQHFKSNPAQEKAFYLQVEFKRAYFPSNHGHHPTDGYAHAAKKMLQMSYVETQTGSQNNRKLIGQTHQRETLIEA